MRTAGLSALATVQVSTVKPPSACRMCVAITPGYCIAWVSSTLTVHTSWLSDVHPVSVLSCAASWLGTHVQSFASGHAEI